MAYAARAASDALGDGCHAQALRAERLHLLDALRCDRVALIVRPASVASGFLEVLLDEVLVAPDSLCDHGTA